LTVLPLGNPIISLVVCCAVRLVRFGAIQFLRRALRIHFLNVVVSSHSRLVGR
jgi:hypothetical protein